MNNIVNYQDKALSLFTEKDIELLRQFDELEAKVKLIKKQRDKALKELFRECDEKTFENDLIKIIYTKPHKRKSIDTEKLKKEGIYEMYLKESDVSDSIKIEVKYE